MYRILWRSAVSFLPPPSSFFGKDRSEPKAVFPFPSPRLQVGSGMHLFFSLSDLDGLRASPMALPPPLSPSLRRSKHGVWTCACACFLLFSFPFPSTDLAEEPFLSSLRTYPRSTDLFCVSFGSHTRKWPSFPFFFPWRVRHWPKRPRRLDAPFSPFLLLSVIMKCFGSNRRRLAVLLFVFGWSR